MARVDPPKYLALADEVADPARGVDLGQLALALERARPRACVASPAFDNPLGGRMSEPDK